MSDSNRIKHAFEIDEKTKPKTDDVLKLFQKAIRQHKEINKGIHLEVGKIEVEAVCHNEIGVILRLLMDMAETEDNQTKFLQRVFVNGLIAEGKSFLEALKITCKKRPNTVSEETIKDLE